MAANKDLFLCRKHWVDFYFFYSCGNIVMVISMQQYFAKDKVNNRFILDDSDLFHIEKVMRMKNDDLIYVSFEDKIYESLIKFNKGQLSVECVRETVINNELNCNVTLIYGLPKGDKFEFVVQKATELGVATIVPFAASRSVSVISKDKEMKKLERWNKIAKEASEQSKRNRLVKVEKVCDEDSILNYKSKLNLVAYEDVSSEGCNKLYNLLSKKYDSITLVVGPEGGFEQREIDHLVENGFEVVSLGKRILRSETAPLFLMSIISYMYECGEDNE